MKTRKSYFYYSIIARNEFLRILVQLRLKIAFARYVALYLSVDAKLVSYRTTIHFRALFDIVVYEIKNRTMMRFSGELSGALMGDGLCF